eukprot:587323-Pelagomonas_calceolata.AAC.1
MLGFDKAKHERVSWYKTVKDVVGFTGLLLKAQHAGLSRAPAYITWMPFSCTKMHLCHRAHEAAGESTRSWGEAGQLVQTRSSFSGGVLRGLRLLSVVAPVAW